MDEGRQMRMERKIVTASIIDTEFLRQSYTLVDPGDCGSDYASKLLQWVFTFWEEYKFAPGDKIRDIYETHLDAGRLSGEEGEVIEEILDNLSREQEKWNDDELEYQSNRLVEYANASKARRLAENVEDSLDTGNLEDALEVIETFRAATRNIVQVVTPLGTPEQKAAVFGSAMEPIFTYPGAIGELINPHLYKKGFVVLLAQNKGGKSFLLADAAMRAGEQGINTLIYQAGDMDQVQQERRMAIYSAKKSNMERYCGPLLIPIPDCKHNQLGDCEYSWWINRDENTFPFDDQGLRFFDEKLGPEHMQEAFQDFRTHKPCIECLRRGGECKSNFKGTPWWRRRPKVDPLDLNEYNHLEKQGMSRFITPFKGMKNIKMSTHSNETLSMSTIESDLRILRDEGWNCELLISDYLDLMASDRDTLRMIPRDQENKKWQRARRISQDWDLNFLSASQSDAQGFDKILLDRSNFSEDRRKLDHVTAMLGLNMSVTEKLMGIMRINEIIARETDGTKVVKVLHRLEIGRPILQSFY